MFYLYQVLVGLIFFMSFPFLLIWVLITGKHRSGLSERLGFIACKDRKPNQAARIWIHAASIGEINGARIIISRLKEIIPEVSFVITTMTIHGRDYGRELFGAEMPCFLAPLDIPLIVDRVIRLLKPDVYVCLETELWPLVLMKTKRSGAAMVLLNGRISDKSIHGYRRIRFLIKPVLRSFDQLGVISSIDRNRFNELGAYPGAITVTGNIKYDATLPDDHRGVRKSLRELLHLDEDIEVFVGGSTHDPEEELLINIYQRVGQKYNQVWLIAPRHLARLAEIKELLLKKGIGFDLFSDCKLQKMRKTPLILVDTFGDLANLYSIATYVFVGGTFTNYGGHNLLEAAIWNNVVFFGPYVQDFQEAADRLIDEGGGMCCHSPDELEGCLERFSANPSLRKNVSKKAGITARKQHDIGTIQTNLVICALDPDSKQKDRTII